MKTEVDSRGVFRVWTDGGHRIHTTRVGGWGYVIDSDGQVFYEDCGCAKSTTSMEMEITAVIRAISYIVANMPAGRYVFHTDSQVVAKAVNEWIPNWKSLGWRRPNRKPLKNKELWKQLDSALELIDCEIKWVKGHAGLIYNERAHELADQAIPVCEKTINEY